MKLSVIIPTLNEALSIRQTLQSLFAPENNFHEVIVVDGGSVDDTLDICGEFPCRVIQADQQGRSFQMNQGAAATSSDTLFFLHADTVVPPKASAAIRKGLENPEVCAGGFCKVFDRKHLILNGEIRKCKLRYRLLRSIAGDQGLFVRANVFREVGGYPPIRVMEEFALCKKLRQKGRLVLLPEIVRTSSRRFFSKGIYRCYIRMFIVAVLFYLRFPPRIFERVYYSE